MSYFGPNAEWAPHSATPSGGRGPLGESRPGSGSGAPVVAPTTWLFAAAASAALAAIVAAWAHWAPRPSLPLMMTSWVLGGFVSVGLLSGYSLHDARRRASPWYLARRWVGYLQSAVILLATLAVIASAAMLASWAGHQNWPVGR